MGEELRNRTRWSDFRRGCTGSRIVSHPRNARAVRGFTSGELCGPSGKLRTTTLVAEVDQMDVRTDSEGRNLALWMGIAVGAAVGIGIALSRRKASRWDSARAVGRRVADRSGDLAESTRDIVGRVRVIYDEACKVMDEAGQLWNQGRKMVGV
jgi:hypothetical protein